MPRKCLGAAVPERGRCRRRVELRLHQEADDDAGGRQHHRPADPVAERRHRADEREVPLPGLVGVDGDTAGQLREHRRRLGVDVVVEGAEDHGHGPQDHGAPAAKRQCRAAEAGDQEAWVRERNHEPVEPADGLEEFPLLNDSSSHTHLRRKTPTGRKRALENSIATNWSSAFSSMWRTTRECEPTFAGPGLPRRPWMGEDARHGVAGDNGAL